MSRQIDPHYTLGLLFGSYGGQFMEVGITHSKNSWLNSFLPRLDPAHLFPKEYSKSILKTQFFLYVFFVQTDLFYDQYQRKA